MSVEYNDKTLKEYARKLCKEFLGGPWKSISFEEFKLFEIRGGLSNSLYLCAIPENAVRDNGEPKEVLLRIYGPIQNDSSVVLTEAVTFMLLSERKLGPKLYGLFPKGRLEEYIPSHSLSSNELRSYSPIIAREMAKIHALDVPVKKEAEMIPVYMTKWLVEVEEIIRNDKENNFMSCEEFRKEMDWLLIEVEKSDSPIVYCHNDLQGGNVLRKDGVTQNGKPNLVLIDFEFGSYNYRGFDFANHFNEWCFDYDTEEYPHFQVDLNKFPTKDEQREFLTAYLDQIVEEGIHLKRPLVEEVEKILKEIPLFFCATNLMWSLWSIKMLLTSTAGFAHKMYLRNNPEEIHTRENGTPNTRQLIEAIEIGIVSAIQEHGKIRRKLYLKFKEQYLSSAS